MPVNERTRQPFGRLHGGASVAFAETVGSVAAGGCVDREKFVGVGMEINADHIRPAYDGYVYATAKAEDRWAGPRRSGPSGSRTRPESWSACRASPSR